MAAKQILYMLFITRYLLLLQSITRNAILNKLTSLFRLSDKTPSVLSG
ncbi:hypothetical protein PT008_04915 [Proteus mirabilis]|nr:hypothetical protein [Proteus mirabilis]WFC28859.1 hypothetical protein PT008_00900 [Proteus mirabilis]WFC29049.1 hypothetical protein PT008_02045 [Proteus mirabilis]WFC29567.1 hypothetical protein PT008_04915 [Proteus mirabilis]